MNDDGKLQDQQGGAPRPVVVSEPDGVALTRSVAVDDGFGVVDGEARSTLPERGEALRSVAVGHGHDELQSEMPPTNPFAEPDDGARSNAVSQAADDGGNAAGRGHLVSGHFVSKLETGEDQGEARPVAASHDEMAVTDPEPVDETDEPEAELSAEKVTDDKTEPPVAPPASADLVTVEEAVAIFTERGLPRHMRTIQKYCSRKTGRALVCYQVPTENGIRYMIERASIDRFIGDAAQQAPTGKLEPEPVAAPVDREAASAPAVESVDIFEHPFVQRLEAQVERLESRNENLQREIQNVLTQANERLVELQKANAVAQSESLGTFLLEAERIRRRQDAVASDGGGEAFEVKPPVNREGRQFGTFDV